MYQNARQYKRYKYTLSISYMRTKTRRDYLSEEEKKKKKKKTRMDKILFRHDLYIRIYYI